MERKSVKPNEDFTTTSAKITLLMCAASFLRETKQAATTGDLRQLVDEKALDPAVRSAAIELLESGWTIYSDGEREAAE